MTSRLAATAVIAVLLALSAGPARAGAIYDMDVLLRQPHPFAVPSTAAPPPAGGAGGPTVRGGAERITQAAPSRSAEAAEPAPASSGGGILSEIRLGALVHDQGPFSHNKEDGFDGNLELLFDSPDFLDIIWSPRPHIGVTVNSASNTNQAYLGLSWEWEFWGGAFAGFSWGGAVHDGETTTFDEDKKELGCSVLFRESIDIGYRFFERHALMAHLDHISNAKLCSPNEGLENAGIRYGYRF